MKKTMIAVLAAFVIMPGLYSFVAPCLPGKKNQAAPANNSIAYNKGNHSMTLSWTPFGDSGDYTIARGGSRLATNFASIGSTAGTTFTDTNPNANKYENYYKITRGSTTIVLSLENQIFGDNIYFYDRKYEETETARNEINDHFTTTGRGGANGEWTTKRQAYYFKPNIGSQSYDPGGSGSASSPDANPIELGFYSHIGGLGKFPGDVRLGSIFTRPHLSGGANATCTFWRSMENVAVMRDFAWTVSQSTSARRMLIESTSKYISDVGTTNFWGSGGFIADSHYTSSTRPNWGGQQQWYTRNTIFPSGVGSMGGSYNMVWQGCVNAPDSNDTNSPVPNTPVIREKPFLFIDEIEDFLPGEYAIGVKKIMPNEDFFQGHFPQEPVMPGVLIVEALAQTGAVAILSLPENEGKIAYFAGINKCKFTGKVSPGDTLKLETKIIRRKGPIGVGEATAFVDGEKVAQGELMFAIQ